MRHYELMVILDPSLEERTVAPSLDQYLNVIRTAGGSVEKLDVWGRRRLAYEISKKAEGIYAVVDMTTEPEVAKELDRQLNLNEAVLRTKLIRPAIVKPKVAISANEPIRLTGIVTSGMIDARSVRRNRKTTSATSTTASATVW